MSTDECGYTDVDVIYKCGHTDRAPWNPKYGTLKEFLASFLEENCLDCDQLLW